MLRAWLAPGLFRTSLLAPLAPGADPRAAAQGTLGGEVL